ncbi:MAG: hypothetical protein IMY72_13560 [Bacteroidetes bacterium]|nr:hypothetical protein [Bacteroidota bacterium]
MANGLFPEHSNSLSSAIDFYHTIGNVKFNILAKLFYTKLSDAFILQKIGIDANGNMLVERSNGSSSVVKGGNVESKIAFLKKLNFQFELTLQNSEYEKFEEILLINSLSDKIASLRSKLRTICF